MLATARGARRLGVDGGVLEVLADDIAFELDLKRWCQDTGARLLEFDAIGSGCRALVQVEGWLSGANNVPPPLPVNTRRATGLGSSRPPDREPTRSSIPPAVPVVALPGAPITVDCRGRAHHAIAELSRVAARHPGATLTFLVDDLAVEIELNRWSLQTGATIGRFVPEEDGYCATIRLVADLRSYPEPYRTKHDPPAFVTTIPVAADTTPAVRTVGSQGETPSAMHARRRTLPEPAPSRTETKRPALDLRRISQEDLARTLAKAEALAKGKRIVVCLQDDSCTPVLIRWISDRGHRLRALKGDRPVLADIEFNSEPEPIAERRAAIFVQGPDKESLLAALVVANTSASQGMQVSLFFSYWALNLLRDSPYDSHVAKWSRTFFRWMTSSGLHELGQDAAPKACEATDFEAMEIPALMKAAIQQDVRFIACTRSMDTMGIDPAELTFPNIECGGIAAFVNAAEGADLSLSF